jgi:lipopolysaccharide/colanic/teichoic acid biosynthesis glycosyltransferase/glycosyltransferase involved in cell wall biosynthesis
MGQIKVLHVVTDSVSTVLLRGQMSYLRANGFEPAIVSSPGPALEQRANQEGCRAFGIAMKREIAPLADLRSLFALWRMLRRVEPIICNSGTPKAGLLGGIAGWLAAIPCRVYTLRGLRLETATGLKRMVLALAEKVACRCAHRVICVSASLRDRAVALGLVPFEKTVLLGLGSSNGVDANRFERTRETAARAAELREQLHIGPTQPVVGFAGRLTRDKGLPELVTAFQLTRQQWPEAILLLIGDFESGDPIPAATKAAIESDSGIRHVERTSQVEICYHAMNVFVLPTHREGMPNAVLEAQAAALPAVTTTATGAVDAIEDGRTGLVVPVGDAGKLAEAVISLLSNPDRARQMGQLGRERVLREFTNERVWKELASLYAIMLSGYVEAVAARRGIDNRSIGAHCKRIVDLIVALCVLTILSPILLLIALVILQTMGRPILFRQVRPGKDGNPFTLIKFRTMTVTGSAEVDPSTDAARLTRLGLFLRRFSLDELPQLWNVLKGEMSLIGPRPLLMEYLNCYTEEQAKRHRMKPGITGLAQTKGRNAITWDEKFYWDVWYVNHWNFWLDIRISVSTIKKVIRAEGISQEGHATMDRFGAEKFRTDKIGASPR